MIAGLALAGARKVAVSRWLPGTRARLVGLAVELPGVTVNGADQRPATLFFTARRRNVYGVPVLNVPRGLLALCVIAKDVAVRLLLPSRHVVPLSFEYSPRPGSSSRPRRRPP